jgi:cytochrome c-type biogenesis protein CcmH/NrfF
MSFSKRLLKKENILMNLENIVQYLNADAIICNDEFSKKVYDFYNQGKTKEEIIKYITENK